MKPSDPFTVGLLQPIQVQAFLDWRSGGDAYTLEVLQLELRNFEAGENRIFVAVEKDQLIGTVQLDLNAPQSAAGTKSAYIQALEVKPEYRRQGVAQTLMQHLEGVARGLGFTRLTLMVETDNRAAIGLYSCLGYSEYGRSFWSWKGVNFPTVCLEKSL